MASVYAFNPNSQWKKDSTLRGLCFLFRVTKPLLMTQHVAPMLELPESRLGHILRKRRYDCALGRVFSALTSL